MSTDRIEKKILLRAPHERVWRAISDAQQFGRWFGVAFDGPFTEGIRLTGTIVLTTVDRIEPMRLLSFRWHPFAVEPGVDYGGILLTISESGFDRIPPARRAKAFAAGEGGWEIQTHLIEKYLALQSTG